MTTTDTTQDICARHAGVIWRTVNRYTSNDPAVSREDFWQAACVAILNGNAENVAKSSGFAESTIVGGLARHGCSALVERKNYRNRARQTAMPHDTETGESLADTIPDTDTADTAERHDVASAIRAALDGLPSRERQAVTMRYGIGGTDPHDLRAIGAALGVTLERARQIIARGSERLATVPALCGLLG